MINFFDINTQGNLAHDSLDRSIFEPTLLNQGSNDNQSHEPDIREFASQVAEDIKEQSGKTNLTFGAINLS